MSDDNEKKPASEKSTPDDAPKKKRKPPKKPPLKTKPAPKKKQKKPDAEVAAQAQQASADLGQALTPDALKAMFVDALQKSGLGQDGSGTATPDELAGALPDMLKRITANLGEQMRDALLPQLAAAQNLSADDLRKLQEALAAGKDDPERSDGMRREAAPEDAEERKTTENTGSDGTRREAAPDRGEGEKGEGSEVGRAVRAAIDDYVAENAASLDAEGNPTARVDGEFLREHAGQMLSNALGALVQAFVPAAEQLGQRLADSATPPREGEASKKKPAPDKTPERKKVNYEVDFAGLVGSLLSGVRKNQSQRRRPRKVEPTPEPPTDVTGEPHGEAAEIVEAVGEAEAAPKQKKKTAEKKSPATKPKTDAKKSPKKKKKTTSTDDDAS